MQLLFRISSSLEYYEYEHSYPIHTMLLKEGHGKAMINIF